MKRLAIITVITVILALWLAVGCGSSISQQQFDSVTAELQSAKAALQESRAASEASQTKYEAAQAKVSELTTRSESSQAKYDTAQAKAAELSTNLDKAQADLKDVQARLESAQKASSTFKSDVTAAWNRFDRVAALEWLLVHYWAAAGKNDTATIEQDNAKIVGFVAGIGDTQMTSLWKQALDAYNGKNQTLYMQSLVAVMERNNMLFNQLATAVREKLK